MFKFSKHIRFLILISGFFLFVSNGEMQAQSLSKDFEFKNESPYALVVIGVSVADVDFNGPNPRDMRAIWQSFDPQTKFIKHFGRNSEDRFEVYVKGGPFFKKKNVGKTFFRIFKVLPGDYVLAWIRKKGHYFVDVPLLDTTSFDEGTIGFHAQAGKFYYLGNFIFNKVESGEFGFEFSENSFTGLSVFLSKYKNITMKPTSPFFYKTQFECTAELEKIWSFCEGGEEWVILH